MHHARLKKFSVSFTSRVLRMNRICVGEENMTHTNGIESEEKIGRNDDNDDPSATEGINGLRRKDMFPTQTPTDKYLRKISYPN